MLTRPPRPRERLMGDCVWCDFAKEPCSEECDTGIWHEIMDELLEDEEFRKLHEWVMQGTVIQMPTGGNT